MIARVGLIVMLMLATWMPFQAVAAWRMMDAYSFGQSVQTMSSVKADMPHGMKASCNMPVEGTQNTVAMNHDSVPCSSCLPLCSGVPPISLSLKEFSRQETSVLVFSLPIYHDHVPAVVSPPPVSFVL